MTDVTANPERSPYPGLRPFRPDEADLFFGRDEQVDELLRFRPDEGLDLGEQPIDRDEAAAFVALLLRSAAETDVSVYVVLTMRSDFLGHCAVFTGLPEALNDGQFLTPRLTFDQ